MLWCAGLCWGVLAPVLVSVSVPIWVAVPAAVLISLEVPSLASFSVLISVFISVSVASWVPVMDSFSVLSWFRCWF